MSELTIYHSDVTALLCSRESANRWQVHKPRWALRLPQRAGRKPLATLSGMSAVNGDGRMLVFAHRGGAGEAPESSFRAMDHAYGLGVDGLEVDVHPTRDGELVIFHDDTLDRTTDSQGPVREWTFARLIREVSLQRGSPLTEDTRIHTLDELLARYPQVFINVDIKEDDGPNSTQEVKLIESIDRHGAYERVVVASFHDAPIKRLRSLSGDVLTAATPTEALLWYQAFLDGRRATGKVGFVALQVPLRYDQRKYLSSEMVSRVHDDGVALHVWTVNDLEEMQEMKDLGVDGIFTDYPARALEVTRG